MAEQSLVEYRSINFIGIFLSLSFFLSFVVRLLFNNYSKYKLSFDVWLMFDLLAGFVNIIAFNFVGSASADEMLEPSAKLFYDY